MFTFGTDRPRRKPSLTPMIDVVFLLLVFFMLAARFGTEGALPLSLAVPRQGAWTGPPRLVDIRPDGLRLNGGAVAEGALVDDLRPLMQSPAETVVLRPRDGASLQRLVDVIEVLRDAGLTGFVLLDQADAVQ